MSFFVLLAINNYNYFMTGNKINSVCLHSQIKVKDVKYLVPNPYFALILSRWTFDCALLCLLTAYKKTQLQEKSPTNKSNYYTIVNTFYCLFQLVCQQHRQIKASLLSARALQFKEKNAEAPMNS